MSDHLNTVSQIVVRGWRTLFFVHKEDYFDLHADPAHKANIIDSCRFHDIINSASNQPVSYLQRERTV
jgi:hypothetical protein